MEGKQIKCIGLKRKVISCECNRLHSFYERQLIKGSVHLVEFSCGLSQFQLQWLGSLTEVLRDKSLNIVTPFLHELFLSIYHPAAEWNKLVTTH